MCACMQSMICVSTTLSATSRAEEDIMFLTMTQPRRTVSRSVLARRFSRQSDH